MHLAEVLCQTEGVNVNEGGRECGNAWFESVATAVKVKIRLGIYTSEWTYCVSPFLRHAYSLSPSSFAAVIVKNNI